MIKKIDYIKNLGIFSEYSAESTLPDFKKFNVFYGDNGAGKTTLSRLLSSLGNSTHPEYPDLRYKITLSDNSCVTNQTPFSRKVRVFNSDYISKNLGTLEEMLEPIFIIGEEFKELKALIKSDEDECEEVSKQIKLLNTKIDENEVLRGKEFTAIAKTIGEATSGSVTRTYRKNNAEDAYKNFTTPAMMADAEVELCRSILRQEQLPKVTCVEFPTVELDGITLKLEDAIKVVITAANVSCSKTALAISIDRLKKNPDISNWVELGLSLHDKHSSTECEFCGGNITNERIESLEKYFNEDDQNLKRNLENIIQNLRKIDNQITALKLPDSVQLYGELRSQYQKYLGEFSRHSECISHSIATIFEILRQKINDRNSIFSIDQTPNVTDFLECLRSINGEIEKHNEKTNNFDKKKIQAVGELEAHYLSTIDADIKNIDSVICQLKMQIEVLQNGDPKNNKLGLRALEQRIAKNKSLVSTAHKAGGMLSKKLQTFLGRRDLEIISNNDGYQILRNGVKALRLSEGEKTAIAFTYFVVQLEDQAFSIPDGVIVIDDPISSLDTASMYQAFAFLKNSVINARQVFLLTHNFGFLRLLLNWLTNQEANKSCFYMLAPSFAEQRRVAGIRKLDGILIENPTEYHYLFKLLLNFQDGVDIEGAYQIPNIARKVLETFLDFYSPSKKNLYKKLAAVNFDEDKKIAIHKFVNDSSHFTGQGFEPGIAAESYKNAKYLLEMISKVAPMHYQGMIESVGSNSASQ